MPTGKYRGERGTALVALGLSSADFRRNGAEILLDVPDNRLRPLKIDSDPPEQGSSFHYYISPSCDVVHRTGVDGSFVGPITIYRNNYDASFFFGYTYPHARLPCFNNLLVEIHTAG